MNNKALSGEDHAAQTPLDHATLKAGEYFVRITHDNPRFGVEEHYASQEKMLGFLNGRYANAQPNDIVTVRIAPDHR